MEKLNSKQDDQKRYEFTEKTRQLIAKRAGFRCSFPGCNKLLIGPSPDGNGSISLGECAHIYAAAGQGPRGQVGLSEDAIKSEKNGIFLCKDHHDLIDSAEGSKKYDAQTLIRMKDAHEYQISCDMGMQQRPIMSIKSLTFVTHPFFDNGTTFNLTNATILIGDNGSGKTAFIESLYGILKNTVLNRWENDDMEVFVTMGNPIFQVVSYQYHDKVIRYFTDNHQIGFCPYDIDVFLLSDNELWNCNSKECHSDIEKVARKIGIQESIVRVMIESVDLTDSIMVSDVKIIEEDLDGQKYERLYLTLNTNDRQVTYFNLSSSQKFGFILDLICGYMKRVARFKHAILLIDDVLNNFDKKWKSFFLASLQKIGNYVQTIITTGSSVEDIALVGWNYMRLSKKMDSVNNKIQASR